MVTIEELTDEQIDFYIQLLSEEKARRLIPKEKTDNEIISSIKQMCNNLYIKLYSTIMNEYLYKEIQEDKEELELNDL